MAKFIPDIKTQRWVVIAPGRLARPSQVREVEKPGQVIKKGEYFWRADCPFCFGNESDTHEVIIHSPDHKLDFSELPLSQVEIILKVYRERYRSLTNGGQVLIFNNKGIESGESLVHPHSQVAVFPRQIRLDVLPLEPIRNIVSENTYFITFCPDFSQWPYETWIAAKRCCQAAGLPAEALAKAGCTFGEVTDEELSDLAKILQEILQKLQKLFPDLSYNFYIAPGGCWYLRIIPRLTERAGLELGTGLHVNTIDPAKAAEDLKK
ncbi:hypothetical protein HZB97_00490 [Candidatus Gottesmanbacteria bacterium]|nr:hypothetical protein [Candidatus Gottesmanbacteria bacterium]